MSDQEILDILLEFKEVLSQGWIITDVFRGLGWIIILGLGWLVDSLENVTDSILGLKAFFADSDITSFLEILRPLSVILMAFSLLYTGYLLIFQKKVDREAVIVNIFLALVVIVLLGTGMDKANHFTDDAIGVLKGEEGDGTLASGVIKSGILDIGLYDLQGWDDPEIDPKSNIPDEAIRDIDINSYLADGSKITKDKELTDEGVEILSQKIDTLGDGSYGLKELDDGNFITKVTKEYYYRYTVDWFTVMVTLAIMAFTLLTIAIKLAKLFFELTFNYVLATIIAPADIHSGQKTKQVIQNILSIFLVTIMIFLSMKIYILGTAFIDETLTGLPYLVALFAFSLAVIDGPNIVERLFGIDAGLKSGWGALAGAYAGGKGLSQGVKALSSAGKSSALKGLSGVAGVAGMANGLKSNGQDQGKEQEKASQGDNEKTQGKNLPENKNAKELNDSNGASEEVNSGMQQIASTLEQEEQQQEKGQTGNNTQGLHQEMASQGVGGNGNQSAAVNGVGSTAPRNSVGSQAPRNGVGSTAPRNSVGSTAPRNGGGSTAPRNSVGSTAPISDGGSSSPAPNYVPDAIGYVSTNNTPSSSSANHVDSGDVQHGSGRSVSQNTTTPQQVERTENTRETRHIGRVITDNVQKNKTVQRVQRSYQIGQNTGESVRRNIANYRRNNKKGE